MTAGGLAAFALLAAAALARHQEPEPEPAVRPRGELSRALAAVSVGVLSAAHIIVVLLPTQFASLAIRDLQRFQGPSASGLPVPDDLRRRVQSTDTAYFDPTVARAAARRISQFLHAQETLESQQHIDWLQTARSVAITACAQLPESSESHALLARLANLAWQHGLELYPHYDQPVIKDAIVHWDLAVERYPTNPRLRISAGTAWFELWKIDGDADAAARARAHFDEALRINDLYAAAEVRRLRDHELAPVLEMLNALPDPATQP
jgi:hypothetical protein